MSDKNSWATPPGLFAELHAKYAFTVDACALPWNAKLPRYWTPEQDGLMQDWRGERVFCNPPYGKGLIAPWVAQGLRGDADVAVFILPARTEMPWFQALWAAHIAGRVSLDFRPERVRFVPPPGIEESSPMERTFIAAVYR